MINIVMFIYHHGQVSNMITYNDRILNAIARADETKIGGSKVRVNCGDYSQEFGSKYVANALGVPYGNIGEMAVKILDLKDIEGPKEPTPLEKKPAIPYII
jgi:hypothetical protein